jgi:hypothetical protein
MYKINEELYIKLQIGVNSSGAVCMFSFSLMNITAVLVTILI